MIQILYQSIGKGDDSIVPFLKEESSAMEACGFAIGTQPMEEAQTILYRGTTIWNKESYPHHKHMIQGWAEYSSTLFLSQYYPLIEDLTTPTFFCKQLDDNTIKEIKKRKWEKAFVKNDVSALVSYGKDLSTWPTTSFDEMLKYFDKMPKTNIFAIRKWLDLPLYSEDRYWILNGKAYHKSGIIPEIVQEAIIRLKPIGSKYYAIDATPELIIEINPGETSDRYYENPPELFAKWFFDAFTNQYYWTMNI